MNKIRIGIFGTGRGMSIARNLMLCGGEVVAICDSHKERREEAAKKLSADVAQYDNFDDFINHEMDAVVLANYFHEHAPYAIRCLEKGIHVLSECTAAGTMAECVALVRAAEKSNAFYMLAENYPFFIFNREMKRVYESGLLGKVLYAEGEYNHPGDPMDIAFKKQYTYFPEHWRNFNPRSYYITHSLAPIMYATGVTPRRVTAFASFVEQSGAKIPSASHVGDRAALVMTQNDDGSVFRVTGCASFGGHHNAYRICGTKGQIENLRGMGNQVMLRLDSWSKPEEYKENTLYEPKWNDRDEELIKGAGHGGGDFFVAREFLDCIRENRKPEMDVYFATVMSAVAILAHRSILENGKPFDVPDFRQEADRVLWENDTLTPYYHADGSAPDIPCCSHPDYKPTDEQMKMYKELVMGIKE